nr:hypothetical protein [Arthrobacter sp. L77]
MTSTMNCCAEFVTLFGSFNGYIKRFHFDDTVDAEGVARFLLLFDNFKTSALPPACQLMCNTVWTV